MFEPSNDRADAVSAPTETATVQTNLEACSQQAAPAHDPVMDALAWFIMSDEANAGGDWESQNAYWLQGRRLAMQYFACHDDIHQASDRHVARMETRDWPIEIEEDFPKTASAHARIEAQQRIHRYASIPIGD